MENEAGMSASVMTVDGVLMFLRREFAIMQILEKGSGVPLLFVGHVQIAVQGSGIAENGGKYSVQVFGSCSPLFKSSHSSHQDEGAGHARKSD